MRTGRIVDMFLTAILRTGTKNDYLFHFLVPHRISNLVDSSRVVTLELITMHVKDGERDMIIDYKFEGENNKVVYFDNSKTVRELIFSAFDQFGYYEPAGMDIVTLFQCHHSKSNVGWFTRDTSRICAEEIENLTSYVSHIKSLACFTLQRAVGAII